MNKHLSLIVLACSSIAFAQGASQVYSLRDVAAQFSGARNVNLMTARVPQPVLNALNTASRLEGFAQAKLLLPKSQIWRVFALCSGRNAIATPQSKEDFAGKKILVYQWAEALDRFPLNPILSITRSDDSSVLVQGPLLGGRAGETRISSGGVAISNAGAQMIAVFAQGAVLAYAC